MIVGIIPR